MLGEDCTTIVNEADEDGFDDDDRNDNYNGEGGFYGDNGDIDGEDVNDQGGGW